MYVSCVVVGAGHAGIAMSRRLTERSIDHVVLERGDVANSWRTERWESLRTLTPNYQNRLPGTGPATDPAGYSTMPEIAAQIASFAVTVGAPVETATTVTRLGRNGRGYVVETDRGVWACSAVVLASGACNLARVPGSASAVPDSIATWTPLTYRSPADLDERGVLVVGASASGVQIADELRRTGRAVTLAVGEHVRMPRTYRGRDVFWWMHESGILDHRHDEVDDLARARRVPSPQLVGSPDRRSVDLNALADRGVRVVGRLAGVVDGVAKFSGGLANACTLADLKMYRLLDAFDAWAAAAGCSAAPSDRPAPTRVPARPVLEIDLRSGELGTIVWATGYRADHTWLDLPVFDRAGRVRHDGGVVTDSLGLYLLGGNLLRRRRSSYISGADADATDLASHLHRHLDRLHAAPRTPCFPVPSAGRDHRVEMNGETDGTMDGEAYARRVIPDTHLDLTEAPIATLATIGPDGRPQLSAVWFLYEDGRLRLSLSTARQKTKNLLANPAVTLFLIEPDGRRYLEVRGDATTEPDDDYEFASRVGAKYGGIDLRNMDRPGDRRLAVTIVPARVNAIDMTRR